MTKSFSLQQLPIDINTKDLLFLYKKVIYCRLKIVKFNNMLSNSPVKEAVILLFSKSEAVESVKIEGTDVTFEEVIEEEVSGKINSGTKEVQNYLEALEYGCNTLNRLPIRTRLILELHQIILKDSASYIPPEPQKVYEYMSNLEKYINDEIEEDIDPIIKAGIIHGQFQSIHPFGIGNGRLGRILIILYLLEKKVIDKPAFFMSEHLEKNKFKYYSLLNGLRSENPKWLEWLDFFIDAAIEQSEYYTEKLIKIDNIYMELMEFARVNNINPIYINAVFKKPYFTIKDIVSLTGQSYQVCSFNIKKLLNSRKIYPDDKKRDKTYRFYDLVNILRK